MSLSLKWRIKRWFLKKATKDIYAVHINETNGLVLLYKGSGHGGVCVGLHHVNDLTARKEGEPQRQLYLHTGGEKPSKPWPIKVKPPNKVPEPKRKLDSRKMISPPKNPPSASKVEPKKVVDMPEPEVAGVAIIRKGLDKIPEEGS